jgi:excisionase family DNA binding protein
LTAEEVATYLKCHVSTVYDFANGGRLKAFSLTGNTNKNKRGKKGLRILASSVDDLVATGLAEREPARPVQPEPQPVPLPHPQATTQRPRSAGSRVTLPRPGRSR